MLTPRRKTVGALAAAVALSALAACSPAHKDDQQAAGWQPVTVQDCGKEVSVKSEPKKVMTIGQSPIALLDAAGASDRIIARAGEFGAPLPSGLKHEPKDAKIVDPSDPKLEAIVSTKPDLLFSGGLFNAKAEDVEAAGITVLTQEGQCEHSGSEAKAATFDLIGEDILRLGKVFGTSDKAQSSVDAMKKDVDEATKGVKAGGEQRSAAIVYYFSGKSPMSAVGSTAIGHEQLTKAGLKNVYGDVNKSYIENASLEDLLKKNPQVIVLNYGFYGDTFEAAKKKFLSEPGTSSLDAVKNNRIVGISAVESGVDPWAVQGLKHLVEQLNKLP